MGLLICSEEIKLPEMGLQVSSCDYVYKTLEKGSHRWILIHLSVINNSINESFILQE